MAFTTRSWELQARNATDSSRCRAAPLRRLRAGLVSIVRRVTSAQPPLGKVLRCWDMVKVRDEGGGKKKNRFAAEAGWIPETKSHPDAFAFC